MNRDISMYYQEADHAKEEEIAWTTTQYYRRNAQAIQNAMPEQAGFRLLEVCCGTGWVPAVLPDTVAYMGVDDTPQFISWARYKNRNRANTQFLRGDLRELLVPTLGEFDVVAMFAALKHFSLDEWDAIVMRVLGMAPVGVLDIAVSDVERDNGTEFHHVFVDPRRAVAAIEAAGHVVTGTWTTWSGVADDIPCEERVYTTAAVLRA